MRPPLRDFFASMARYFESPHSTEDVLARHPGWDVRPTRLALYGDFVFAHVSDTLAKLYPLTRSVVGEQAWRTLVERYYATRPARRFEMNSLGEGLPGFLNSADLGLPSFVPSLATFEWTDFSVFAREVEVPTWVERLTVNPTLTAIEHPFRLASFVRAGDARPSAPEPGQELLLLWRHPTEHRTYFVEADDAALLVIKLALESIPLEDAARAGGVPEDAIRTEVVRFATLGLVLSPASLR